jgi:hypothetical protein
MFVPVRLFAGLLLLTAPVWAADLEIRYGALERLVNEQMFTAEGRRYVRGNKSKKCQYAYMQDPKLAASGSKLQLKVHFDGRSAMNLLGSCVGVGDTFDLTITAKPVPRDGSIAFDELVVSTPRDSFYIRRVRSAVVETFNRDFRIDVRDQAKRLLEAPAKNATYQQELRDLKLSGVRVTPDALVLEVDFKLVVK